jgi:hypothetical protein
MITPKYCPNIECADFQHEIATCRSWCLLCASELLPVRKQSDSVKEDTTIRSTRTYGAKPHVQAQAAGSND